MDWKKLVKDLSEAGISHGHIARESGCSQPTITDLANGHIKSPSWGIGQTIVNLHVKHVGVKRAPVAEESK